MPKPRALARPTLRAVLYLRQSVHREESISLELQETAGRAYCAQHGYEVVAVEADPGISGRTWKRPAVQRVMDMIERRDAEVIVLWKWSRLSRSRLDWAVAVDRVETSGGRIESATEPIDTTTSTGRLARGMLTEFAAFESERIGDVWREAHQRRRKQGLPAQGGRRFGYRISEGAYEPDPETGPVLAEAYRRYIAGEGFTRIVRWLNSLDGGDWNRVRVTRMLDSGFGAGLIIHNRSDPTYYPGAHPPVITEREWTAYLERRAEAPRAPRTIEPSYFLTGLIKCGDCGAPMHVGSVTARGSRPYTCSRYNREQTGRYVSVMKHRAEAEVRAWVRAVAADLDGFARAEASAVRRRVTAVNDHRAIVRRIAEIDSLLLDLTDGWQRKIVPEAAYTVRANKLQSERDSLSVRMQSAERAQRPEVDARSLAIELDKLWDQMTVLEQRNMLAELIDEVRVRPAPEPGRHGVSQTRIEIVAPLFQ